MNPEDQIPSGSPQQGAPATGLSDAEYQNQAAQLHQQYKKEDKPVEVTPVVKPEPSALSKFSATVRSLNGGDQRQFDPIGDFQNKVGAAIVRGGAKVVQGVSNTADAVLTPIMNKMFGPSKTPHHELLTDGEIDAGLGKKQPGVFGVIEDITKYTGAYETGAAALPEMAGAAAPAVAKMAARAVTMGAGAAVALDPQKDNPVNAIVAVAPSWLATPLKDWATNPTDGAFTARAKSAMGNLMTNFAVDSFFAAATGAVKPVYNALVNGPVRVVPTPEGAFQLEHAPADGQFVMAGPGSEATRLQTMYPDGPPGVQVEPSAEGSKIVHVVARNPEGKAIGSLVLQKTSATEAKVFTVHVSEGSRRQGVATSLYDAAEKSGLKLTSGQTGFSADGKAFIEARTGKPAPSSSLQEYANKLLGPVYETSAEAEAAGATINNAVKNEALPRGELTEAQVKATIASGKELDPQDLVLSSHPDFEFNYNATPEETAKVVTQVAENLPRSGVQTHAETVALADDLFNGKSGDEVVQMLRDKNVATQDMPQWVYGAANVLQSLGNTIVKLGRAATAQPENQSAFEELVKATGHLLDVHGDALGLKSTAGRALNATQIAVGDQAAHEVVNGATAAIDHFKGWAREDYLAFARLIENTEGGAQRILKLKEAQDAAALARNKPVTTVRRIMDAVNNVRMSAMLWGPVTHVTTLASNIMTTLQRPAEVWWGGVNLNAKGLATGEGWGVGSAMQQKGADMMAGVFLELKDAIKAGAVSFRSGTNILDASNGIIDDAASSGQEGILNGAIGIAKLPSRLLMTNDEVFKTLNYRSFVRAKSLSLSRSMGITDPAQLASRLAGDMKAAFSSTGAALDPEALAWGRVATQQQPLVAGSPAQVWQQAVQQFPPLRLVTPFTRTPANLFNYAWDRTPVLNLLQSSIREDFAAGGERAALAASKTQMGMVMWGGAAMLAHAGQITGGGPLDPTLRQQWKDAGHEPYSIKLPGLGWFSYKRGNPIFTAVGIAADLVEMAGELPADGFQEHAAMFVASVVSNITNQSFMQGLSETLDASSDKSGRALQKYLISLEASFIPNVTRQLNPDDTIRETRGAIDELKSRIPGLSNTLEPRRNILGEKVMKGPGLAQRAMNPFTFSKPVDDHSVLEQLVSMGKAMSMPPESIGKVRLTDRDLYDNGNGKRQSPYDRYLELCDKPGDGQRSLKADLTSLMKSETWKTMYPGSEAYPGGERYKYAARVISQHQDQAFKQVKQEYPKLDAALRGEKFDKKAAVHATPSQSSALRPQFLSQ